MINWWRIGSAALWIIGLAILLAAYSYHRHDVAQQSAYARHGRGRYKLGFVARLGLLFLSVGLGATSDSWLERGMWGIIALGVVLQFAVACLHVRRNGR